MKEADRTGARVTVRLPPKLHAAIKEAAAADHRTVSNWIVLKLGEAAAATKKPKG